MFLPGKDDRAVMDKHRLSRLLVEGDRSIAAAWADAIASCHDVAVERPPHKSLVMARARDSVRQQPFYVGEILVTECTVKVDGVIGFGMIMGDEPDMAWRLAVIDAACNAHLPEVEEWLPRLLAEERVIAARQQGEYTKAARTRVNFETVEDYIGKV